MLHQHFFFVPPQGVSAQVTPQQTQLIAQELIQSLNPSAQEFVEAGMSPEQVMLVASACMKQRIVSQQQKQAQTIAAGGAAGDRQAQVHSIHYILA